MIAGVPPFAPFPGLRYASGLDPAVVTSPPYDVIDAAERAALAGSHPANAVHVDCPVGDLGAGHQGGDTEADAYEQAAATLRRWRADGTVVTDDAPAFTLYRMSFTDEAGRARATTGVIGALGLQRPGEGDILPHERTTPKARSDRLDLLRATRANLSPIWGLSMATGLSKLLEPDGHEAVVDFTDDDGVRHQAWRVVDPSATAAIAEAVAGSPVVIADGHHRYETCLAYREEVGASVPGADSTLALVVELADDQLTVQPIHRLVSDLPDGTDVVAALGDAYDATPVDDVHPGDRALVTPDGTWSLARRRPEPALDTEYLDAALAALPTHTVSFQHGTALAADAVQQGRAQAAVLLPPVGVTEISAFAEARDRMPPKTTFFWPKPRTGIVFRDLEGVGAP
jgi:uncharacterized protein (DUF1015 family)